jgi:hypothetical protein
MRLGPPAFSPTEAHSIMRALTLLSLMLALLAPSIRADEKPTPLFNGKDLSGWSTFIPHKDQSDPRGDPKGVFKVEDGVIHVSGEEFGCLTTDKEFENYRLLVEF